MMTRLKNTGTVFLLTLAIQAASIAAAQEIPSRKNEGVQRSETARERHNAPGELHLTADQKAQWAKLQQEHRAAVRALKNSDTLTVPEKKEGLQQLRKEQVRRRTAVLHPEQRKALASRNAGTGKQEASYKTVTARTFEKNNGADSNGLWKESGKLRRADPGLSKAQKQQLTLLSEKYKQQALTLKDNRALGKEEKATRLQALRKAYRREQKKLRTPEQRIALTKQREAHHQNCKKRNVKT